MAMAWEALVSGGITLAAICGVAKYGFSRIKEIDQKAVTKSMCDERHNHINKDLEKGDEKFKAIQDDLKGKGDLLVALNTKMDLLLENNGLGKKGK